MAQEIMVAGAIYEDVPSVRLPDSHGTFHPFTDTSDTTAVAADVAQGKTFHLADGSAATGTAAGATLVTKTVTANGTYDASDDGADGYSEVTVNVSGGGGGGGVDPKDVNFIDYDGTVLHAYTAAEFAELTALPENPTHDGLVAQGWNWTLSDAQEYVADYGIQTIGQMYATDSGDTEIDIVLYEGRLSLKLGLAPNGTVTIDWGDGSATNTVTGTSLTTNIDTSHNYAAAGVYTIGVHIDSGSLGLVGVVNSRAFISGVPVVTNGVKALRIGRGVTLGQYALYGLSRMESVSIPMGTGFDSGAVYRCSTIMGIVFPDGVSELPNSVISSCDRIKRVSIPHSVTTVGSYAFNGCRDIVDVALPELTTISSAMFSNITNSLNPTFIPPSVTELGSSAFSGCSSAIKMVIPSAVVKINDYAFTSLASLSELHFLPQVPPTSTKAQNFNNLPTDCTIYVPTGSLNAYKTASNYPNPATYTYVEE